MHRITCSSRFTWQQNIIDSDLAEISKSQKSATSRRLLCMLVLVTTYITKIQDKHLYRMHTSIMAKMTKELVLIIDSRKQHFGHQDELK